MERRDGGSDLKYIQCVWKLVRWLSLDLRLNGDD